MSTKNKYQSVEKESNMLYYQSCVITVSWKMIQKMANNSICEGSKAQWLVTKQTLQCAVGKSSDAAQWTDKCVPLLLSCCTGYRWHTAETEISAGSQDVWLIITNHHTFLNEGASEGKVLFSLLRCQLSHPFVNDVLGHSASRQTRLWGQMSLSALLLQ